MAIIAASRFTRKRNPVLSAIFTAYTRSFRYDVTFFRQMRETDTAHRAILAFTKNAGAICRTGSNGGETVRDRKNTYPNAAPERPRTTAATGRRKETGKRDWGRSFFGERRHARSRTRLGPETRREVRIRLPSANRRDRRGRVLRIRLRRQALLPAHAAASRGTGTALSGSGARPGRENRARFRRTRPHPFRWGFPERSHCPISAKSSHSCCVISSRVWKIMPITADLDRIMLRKPEPISRLPY